MKKKYNIDNLYFAIIEIKVDDKENYMSKIFNEEECFEYYTVLNKENEEFTDLKFGNQNFKIISIDEVKNYIPEEIKFVTKKEIFMCAHKFYREYLSNIFKSEMIKLRKEGEYKMEKEIIKYPYKVENIVFNNEQELYLYILNNIENARVTKEELSKNTILKDEIEFPYNVSGVKFCEESELYLFVANTLLKKNKLVLAYKPRER